MGNNSTTRNARPYMGDFWGLWIFPDRGGKPRMFLHGKPEVAFTALEELLVECEGLREAFATAAWKAAERARTRQDSPLSQRESEERR